MDQSSTQILVAVIGAVATVIAAWLEHRSKKNPSRKSSTTSNRDPVSRSISIIAAGMSITVLVMLILLLIPYPPLSHHGPAARYHTGGSLDIVQNERIDFSTKDFDTHNAVNPGHGKWEFVAPRKGIYRVQVQVEIGGKGVFLNSTGVTVYLVRLRKGAEKEEVYSGLGVALANSRLCCYQNGGTSIDLDEGDAMWVQVDLSHANDKNSEEEPKGVQLHGDPTRNHISIEYIRPI